MTIINYAPLCKTVTQCTGRTAGVLENPLFEIFVSFSYQIPCCSFPVILFLFFLSIVLRVLCLTALFYCWFCPFCYLVSPFMGSPPFGLVCSEPGFFSVMQSFVLFFFLFLLLSHRMQRNKFIFLSAFFYMMLCGCHFSFRIVALYCMCYSFWFQECRTHIHNSAKADGDGKTIKETSSIIPWKPCRPIASLKINLYNIFTFLLPILYYSIFSQFLQE